MCSDSTRNEQVETSVCRISFAGSSTIVTLLSSRKILLFWKFFVCLPIILHFEISLHSFSSWQILTQILFLNFVKIKLTRRH